MIYTPDTKKAIKLCFEAHRNQTDKSGLPYVFHPFHVAEQFTGMPGQYVPLKETLRGFKMILNGECDELPESAFLFAGTIDDVFAKAKKG